jgi:GT2 family glycosyltransferase
VDTEIDPSCLTRLLARMSTDPRIGLCEARQVPHEHPKEYVPETGETPWCSAACLLVRSRALRDTGLFDERFFLYCEDVDLSWRMWHQGWKCVYVPEATCKHYTLDLAAHKRGSTDEYFFGVRNGILLRVLYGSYGIWLRYLASVLRLILFSRGPSAAEKRLLARALRGQVRHFPHLMVRRWQLRGARRRSPWIRFYGWDYHRPRHAPGAAPEARPGGGP